MARIEKILSQIEDELVKYASSINYGANTIEGVRRGFFEEFFGEIWDIFTQFFLMMMQELQEMIMTAEDISWEQKEELYLHILGVQSVLQEIADKFTAQLQAIDMGMWRAFWWQAAVILVPITAGLSTWENLVGNVQSAFQLLLDGDVTGFAKEVFGAVGTVIKDIGDGVNTLMDKIIPEKKNTLKTIDETIEGIKEDLKGVVDEVLAEVGLEIDALKEVIYGEIDKIFKVIDEEIDRIRYEFSREVFRLRRRLDRFITATEKEVEDIRSLLLDPVHTAKMLTHALRAIPK